MCEAIPLMFKDAFWVSSLLLWLCPVQLWLPWFYQYCGELVMGLSEVLSFSRWQNEKCCDLWGELTKVKKKTLKTFWLAFDYSQIFLTVECFSTNRNPRHSTANCHTNTKTKQFTTILVFTLEWQKELLPTITNEPASTKHYSRVLTIRNISLINLSLWTCQCTSDVIQKHQFLFDGQVFPLFYKGPYNEVRSHVILHFFCHFCIFFPVWLLRFTQGHVATAMNQM